MQRMIRFLLFLMVLCMLAFSTGAMAEAAGSGATARLYYMSGSFWPETNGTNGTSETVQITGEGYYTLKAYFLDQGGWTPVGNGIEKLQLIVEGGGSAGSVMEGMYLGVSAVRVNGTAVEVGNVGYGPCGYDNGSIFSAEDGYAILYDEWHEVNATIPAGMETWNGAAVDVTAVDPAQFVNVLSVEVDFFVTDTQGKLPDAPAGNAARLHYIPGAWWPSFDGSLGMSETVEITGEGRYTVKGSFLDQGGWTPTGDGIQKLMLIIEGGAVDGSVMEGMYLGVSAVRVNGTAVALGNVGYGPCGYDSGSDFSAQDSYAILYDEWHATNATIPAGMETWNGTPVDISAVDPAEFVGVRTIEVDFFVTAAKGNPPAEGPAMPETWDAVLPADLTIIEEKAFAGVNVVSVYIPEGTEVIGSDAFTGCVHLRWVYMPRSVTSIAADAFRDCPDVVLFVEEGSAAQTFAEENGVTCVVR